MSTPAGEDFELSESGDTMTIRLATHPGIEVVIGFPPGEQEHNAVFVRPVEDGVRLTPTLMRKLPYDRLFRRAAEHRTRRLSTGAATKRPYGGKGPRGQFIHEVAEVYRWAETHGVPPRKAIAERWGKSEATAGRWISEARREGALAPYGQGEGAGR